MSKYLLIVSFVLCFIIGCGGNPKLKGKVVFSDDKTPLTQGVVNFISDKGIARGELDKEGNFVVGSEKTNDGLPPGNYRVYLSSTEIYKTDAAGNLAGIEYLIDKKYEDASTSGLTVEVKNSMKYEIEVDRFKR